MNQTPARAEVSVCLSPRGEAAVFVTRDEPDAAPLDPSRFAAAFAARGLRLVGLSSAARPALPGRAGARSTSATLDAVL